MVHPLPEKIISDFAKEVKTLYVIEELEPFIEDQIKKLGNKGNRQRTISGNGRTECTNNKRKILGQK